MAEVCVDGWWRYVPDPEPVPETAEDEQAHQDKLNALLAEHQARTAAQVAQKMVDDLMWGGIGPGHPQGLLGIPTLSSGLSGTVSLSTDPDLYSAIRSAIEATKQARKKIAASNGIVDRINKAIEEFDALPEATKDSLNTP